MEPVHRSRENAVAPPSGAGRTAATAKDRGPDDDFFCLRFQVWYPSIDCAYRTRFLTCPGCARCEQGRFNLSRHRAALARLPRRPSD
jgi:hypothetical protein